LLAEEEASLPSKPVTKGGAKKSGDKKKDVRPAGPGAIAAGGGLGGSATGSGSSTPDVKKTGFEPEPEVHIKATGLDNMLEALEIVNAKGDKANVGAQAGLIEKHPEVSALPACATILLGGDADLAISPASSRFLCLSLPPFRDVSKLRLKPTSKKRCRSSKNPTLGCGSSRCTTCFISSSKRPRRTRKSPRFSCLETFEGGVTDSRLTLTCLQIQPSLSGLQRYQGRKGLCAQRVSGGEGTSVRRITCYVT
jgi:hypothetical protein